MAVSKRDIELLRDSIEHMLNPNEPLVFYSSNGEKITGEMMSAIIDRVEGAEHE